MMWAVAIAVWTLLSLVASPFIGAALAGGRALEVREHGLFEEAARPLRPLA